MSSTITATAAPSLSIDKLARMLSLSSNFQSLVNVSTAADALNRIYFREFLDREQDRPYACIGHGAGHRWRADSSGTQFYGRYSGELMMYMTKDIPLAYQESRWDASQEALETYGLIAEDVASLAAADDTGSSDGTGHLAITEFERIEFSLVPEEEQATIGQWSYCVYSFGWG